jgi:hypothetical protein
MEKLSEADALRMEYLDIIQTVCGTCITGLRRAKAHMVGTFLGMLITMSAFFGALIFLEGVVMIATIVVAVLLTLWWMGTTRKEVAVHEDMKGTYEAMEKRLENIAREYSALTGTDIRDTFTTPEIQQAFDTMLKKYQL